MSTYDNELLHEGILRARAKEIDSARRYLQRALDAADDLHTRMQASFWLSEITTDLVEKRKYLEDVLAIDGNHIQARRALAILDGKLKPEDVIDPDKLTPASAFVQKVSADRFTCPKCGGRMVFAADGRVLICEFCQRGQSLLQERSAENDFLINMATIKGHSEPAATQVFKCSGCGADFILTPQMMSATCAYCGSNHVVTQKELRSLLNPDAIIPMAFNAKQAAWRLVHWVEANKLEPQEKVKPPCGLYMPIWAFNVGGGFPWNGFQVRNKERVEVSGQEFVQYDNLVVPATRKVSRLMAMILPEYQLAAATAYDARYLAGWPTEVYEVSMSTAALEARRVAVEKVREDIHALEGSILELHYSPSDISIQSFRLVLIPVWMTEILVEGQSHRVIINGQNGAVHGETPSKGLLHWLGDLLGVD